VNRRAGERVEPGDFGPVVVRTEGGIRIGYYDDDHHAGRRPLAIVYYCEPPLLFTTHHDFVPYADLRPIDTDVLWGRREAIAQTFIDAADEAAEPDARLYNLALEYAYVNGLLADRMMEAREREGRRGGLRIFISHSSLDQQLALWLSVDLANEGHSPWLDEWEIRAGDSIPLKISQGLDECDLLLVLLSPRAVSSGWVEREWSAKYWTEASEKRLAVIPRHGRNMRGACAPSVQEVRGLPNRLSGGLG
jgi:hypothetical protein